VRARRIAFGVAAGILALPALGLTVARLLQPESTYGIAAVAFAPWALPLYAALLVLGAVRLGVVRRARDLAVPVALVAVAGLAVHGWWYAPQVVGANPAPADGATALVVMSANLRLGEADAATLVQLATEQDVDLLVVQEVTPALLAELDGEGLAAVLPHRAGDPAEAAGGTMAFARTPLTDPARVTTSFGGWAFTMVDLRVLAVHPTYPVDGPGWASDQASVAEAVATEHPDVVVGDFNATMDHAPMRALEDRGYRDVGELANVGWQPTWPAEGRYDHLGVPLAQIDHVLIGPRLVALDQHTTRVPDTDHLALVARVAPR
jgi:endonuclease/exonuclease/phosphatase family protein